MIVHVVHKMYFKKALYYLHVYALSESLYEENKNKYVTACQHLMLLSFSKEITGVAALKRKIREQDKSPGNVNGNASEARVHKKKKDVMVDSISQ